MHVASVVGSCDAVAFTELVVQPPEPDGVSSSASYPCLADDMMGKFVEQGLEVVASAVARRDMDLGLVLAGVPPCAGAVWLPVAAGRVASLTDMPLQHIGLLTAVVFADLSDDLSRFEFGHGDLPIKVVKVTRGLPLYKAIIAHIGGAVKSVCQVFESLREN